MTEPLPVLELSLTFWKVIKKNKSQDHSLVQNDLNNKKGNLKNLIYVSAPQLFELTIRLFIISLATYFGHG